MSEIEDGMTSEERAIVDRICEAWHLILALPAEERWTVTQFLTGCYDWPEVEADATAQWPAALAPANRTAATSIAAANSMWLTAGIMTGYDVLDEGRKRQLAEYVDHFLAGRRAEQRAAKG